MAQQTIISATPGNMVVPLSEIIDLLQGKLSAADLNALLLAVVGQKQNDVRPGDLITADLMNAVLASLADLQVRVATLESATTPTGKPEITSPKPGEIHRISEELHVQGRNFGQPSAATVFIDSTVSVNQFKPGSSDTLLIFDIPFVQNVSSTGRAVALAVRNSLGDVGSTSFWLAQPETLPSGTLTVTYSQAPNVATLDAGGKYTFVYTIRAATTDAEDYTLTPSVSAGWTTNIVDQNDGIIAPVVRIEKPSAPTLPAKATVRVQVEIPQSPGAVTTGQLKLRVTSKRNPTGLFKESDAQTLTIGAKPPAASAIGISLVSVILPGSKQNGVIVVPAPTGGATETNVFASLKAEVPVLGRYSIQPLTFPDDSSGKWSASVQGSSSGVTMTPPSSTFAVSITGKSGAPQATMLVKIVSDADSSVSGDAYQDVSM